MGGIAFSSDNSEVVRLQPLNGNEEQILVFNIYDKLKGIKVMLRKILVFLVFFTVIFSTVLCECSLAKSSELNDCNYRDKNNYEFSSLEQSDYYVAREILSFSDSANDFIDQLKILSSTPLGLVTKIAANVTKGVIYIEDWTHTDKEVEQRINQVLSSPKLTNVAHDSELYKKFEQYVKTSLQEWIPDRDYPGIGYLPKKFLYDQCLGEQDITKYWPEATKRQQAEYIAVNFDELVLNYELFWNNLNSN
jgi:hypothetical protein